MMSGHQVAAKLTSVVSPTADGLDPARRRAGAT